MTLKALMRAISIVSIAAAFAFTTACKEQAPAETAEQPAAEEEKAEQEAPLVEETEEVKAAMEELAAQAEEKITGENLDASLSELENEISGEAESAGGETAQAQAE